MIKKYALLLLLILLPLVSLMACNPGRNTAFDTWVPEPPQEVTPGLPETTTTPPPTTAPPATTSPSQTTEPPPTTTLEITPPPSEPTTPPATTTAPPPPTETAPPTEPTTTTPEAVLELFSSGFANGDSLPAKYGCLGEEVSPPLKWSGAPEGTESFAIIMTDSDAPEGSSDHWIIYNIPADFSGLNEGIPNYSTVEDGIRQGTNSLGYLGYDGPCPPADSSHHYTFRIYALDTMLEPEGTPTRSVLLDAMSGHILAQGELTVTYP